MRKSLLCSTALLISCLVANAATLTVNCGNKGRTGKISTFLKFLNPQGPNTLNIRGTCKENLTISQFDRLSLIATPGAVLQDSSEGQQPVINITDSQRIYIQGFTINGGSNGVLCFNGSLCRFSGNTIEGSTGAGVWVNYSQATFSGDIIQDTGDFGLAIEMSRVSAGGVTVQRSATAGIYDADSSVLGAWSLTIQDNKNDGILVVSQSHMELGGSTITGNSYNGVDLNDQSEALLIQNTITSNNYNGVGIGDLSLAELGNGGTFTGNGTDIGCTGTYSIAANIQAATYGITSCPVPPAQATQQNTPRPSLVRPLVK